MSGKISDFSIVPHEGLGRTYTLHIPEFWAPTSELRWVRRTTPVKPPARKGNTTEQEVAHNSILQQRWVRYVGGTPAGEEWRDVPTAEGSDD